LGEGEPDPAVKPPVADLPAAAVPDVPATAISVVAIAAVLPALRMVT
jgi:hypothetical protein